MIYPEKIKARKSDKMIKIKNVYIAGYILLQTIAISLLLVYMDYKRGMKGWSLNIAIPIIMIMANIAMLILIIVSHKKYIKYVMYQLIITLFSMLPAILATEHMVQNKILSILASGISILNFILALLVCIKDLKAEMIKKFHL